MAKEIHLKLTEEHEIFTKASLVPKANTRNAKDRLVKIKKAIRNTGGFFCYLCGKEILLKDLTIDHVKAKYSGGKNNSKNLKLAHMECNSNKGNMDLTYYRMFSTLENDMPFIKDKWFLKRELKRSKTIGC